MPRRSRSIWLLSILAVYIAPAVLGFAPPATTAHLSNKRKHDVAVRLSRDNNNYNDDAFGFIFLGGSAAAQDPIFGAVFLTLSVAAVIGTKLEQLPANKQVPASVAGLTLLVVPVISAFVPPTVFGTSMVPGDDNARLIELAFCSVSMLYGFVFSSMGGENE